MTIYFSNVDICHVPRDHKLLFAFLYKVWTHQNMQMHVTGGEPCWNLYKDVIQFLNH